MAEATRRLALACRLKPSTPSNNNGDNEEGKSADDMTPQDRIIQERQAAVGEEMMVVLSTLGEVRRQKFVRSEDFVVKIFES
jgi:hypothetical protein